MQDLYESWNALRFGGPMVYPLLALAVIAVAILLDKAYVYWRYARVPLLLSRLIEHPGTHWSELEHQVATLDPRHYFARFLRVILHDRTRPVWWIESRASDEAQAVEHDLSRGLWVLETIVTAAPLLGLLGTITGMMRAFHLIGSKGLVDPNGVTAGVAEALIATALGLLIALIALFGFNLLARLQSRTLDEMERIGTHMTDRIRLEGQDPEVHHEAA